MTVYLVGSAGIVIAATGLFGGVATLGTAALTTALITLAISFAYVYYRGTLSSSPPTATQTTTDDRMSAEEVKQQTERWSREASINPAFPPGRGPEQQSCTAGQNTTPSSGNASESNRTEPGDCRDNQRSSGLDFSDKEFSWQAETDVSFDDIGGMDDLKDELRAEVIKPLENPEKADELGVSAPNIVFHGPPGTGKTFTAQALAAELELPFAMLTGADVQSKWINESAAKVNNLFNEAQEIAAQEGGAVVFLDELDSVLKNRSGAGSTHEEDNKVVNEFLNHLEDTREHNVVFIGATNRPNALDKAGIRPGRIDLKIQIGKPDVESREAILRAHLSDRDHEISEETITELAAATEGAVAADIEQIVNRAAKNVLARGGDTILPSDFD